ncbi:MAG: 30S ribosome-binding factor RbfA [Caldilineaceae bacterium]|nr:30S ribosome-binding factor RbfA [Caldilineaceae bacterium]
MSTIRQERVTELLFQELSIMLGNEMADPRLSLLSVTRVDVSRDLRTVKVYVTHGDKEVSRRAVLAGLKNAAAFLRGQVAQRCGLRVVPELIFYYDDAPERAARVDELLREIAAEREARAAMRGQAADEPSGPAASQTEEPGA